jgi:hypothetical protein
MSNDNTLDDYEIGYGKPPKNTQFQKGVSGNPTGRPKKTPDFHSIFMKESVSLITVNDKGQRRRISKLEGIAKQLHNKALTGNVPAARTCIGLHLQAQDKGSLSAPQQSSDSGRHDNVRYLTEEQLMRIAAGALEKPGKKVESNTYRIRIESAVVLCSSYLVSSAYPRGGLSANRTILSELDPVDVLLGDRSRAQINV